MAHQRPNILQPGSKTDLDPDHLYLTTSVEIIQQWLDAVRDSIDEKCRLPQRMDECASASARSGPLFTEWERNFYLSVSNQFELRNRAVARPLSGKQLVFLLKMYKKLAQQTVEVLVGM